MQWPSDCYTSSGVGLSFQVFLEYASLRGPQVLLVSFLSWLPCVMGCDEQLWYMRQTTVFEPNQRSPNWKAAVFTIVDHGILFTIIEACYADRKWQIWSVYGSA